MTTAELIANARALLATGRQAGAFEALDTASTGDPSALCDALLALDALAPSSSTFLIWADGGQFVADGDRVAVVYRYDRKKAEVQSALELRFPEVRTMWPTQKTLHEHAADALATVMAGLESDVVRAALRAANGSTRSAACEGVL